MNRVIKFRGKNSFLGKWIYAEIQFSGLELFDDAVKEETIGQFTGLYDKNGTEIYEGDIVCKEYTDDKYFDYFVCIWNEYCACLVFKDEDDRYWHFQKNDEKNLKVIGNIHDNPELLEE